MLFIIKFKLMFLILYKILCCIKQLPNKDLVSIPHDQCVINWSLHYNFTKIKEFVTHTRGWSLCILPNNRIATGHYDKIIRVWKFPTFE